MPKQRIHEAPKSYEQRDDLRSVPKSGARHAVEARHTHPRSRTLLPNIVARSTAEYSKLRLSAEYLDEAQSWVGLRAGYHLLTTPHADVLLQRLAHARLAGCQLAVSFVPAAFHQHRSIRVGEGAVGGSACMQHIAIANGTNTEIRRRTRP